MKEDLQCGVHVGLVPAYPDLGVQPGMSVVMAESEVDFPDAEHRGIYFAQRVFPAPLDVQPQSRSQRTQGRTQPGD